MNGSEILIADGHDARRRSLKEVFVGRGFGVIESADKIGTLRNFPDPTIGLIVMGSFEDGAWGGLELAGQIRRFHRKVPIILIAAETSEELAIAALRAGINDYFKQPFSFEEIVASATRYIARCLPSSHQQNTKGPGSGIIDGHRIIGESLALRNIKTSLENIASTDSNLLITAKPVQARSLWQSLSTGTAPGPRSLLSASTVPRSPTDFWRVNCSAMKEDPSQGRTPRIRAD